MIDIGSILGGGSGGGGGALGGGGGKSATSTAKTIFNTQADTTQNADALKYTLFGVLGVVLLLGLLGIALITRK